MKHRSKVDSGEYRPPFTVAAKAISMIAEISALVKRYVIRLEQHDALKLRKANKIKTIQASLAIEGNTLTEGQVTDILDGKTVAAPIREIQEVRNAIAAYDLFNELNPFSVKDLLKAHKVMMSALVDESREIQTWRSRRLRGGSSRPYCSARETCSRFDRRAL